MRWGDLECERFIVGDRSLASLLDGGDRLLGGEAAACLGGERDLCRGGDPIGNLPR